MQGWRGMQGSLRMPASLRGRLDAQRQRRAMQELRRREQLLRPGYKLWGYKNVFAQGFVAARGPVEAPLETWDALRLGPWHLRLDPALDRLEARSASAAVLVLGQAFDDRGPAGRASVAERILRAASTHPHPDAQGEDLQTRALDEAIAWLSGRYVVLVTRGDRLDAWGDPLATRSLYWHRGDGGDVALASHTELLSRRAGGLDHSRMRWVLGHPDYVDPAGRWLPGLITPHDGVGQVYANGRLTVRGGEVTHARFFPLEDRRELAPQEAGERFRAELAQQVRNWIAVAPLTVLAVTAGRDSRAILQAGLPDLQRAEALTMTYHPFHAVGKSTSADLIAGSRLAAAARLQHLPLDVPRMSPTSDMARLYTTTFPTYRRYANLAGALYLQSPARASTIFGVGGAVITGMYRTTDASVPTPEELAAKFTGSAFRDDPALHDELARWMAWTDFSADALRGYEFYDFLHWEHRMSKWAAIGYSEYDLATIPAPVLSSRRLLTTALSLPKAMRSDAFVYRWIAEGEGALGGG